MKKLLANKAEVARQRVLRARNAKALSARGALELRAAARSKVSVSEITPHLALDDLRAKAAAASKQMRRG